MFSIRKERTLIILLFIGFISRVVFMGYQGLDGDMLLFANWADTLISAGVSNFYRVVEFCDYPPGYLYMLIPIGHLIRLFPNANHVIFLKIPAVIFDLLLISFAFKLASTRFSVRGALLVGLAFALNPMIIFNSAIWGQVDSILTIFIILSIYFLAKGKYELSAAVFALALTIKPQALIGAPLFLYAYVDKLLDERTWQNFWYWTRRLLQSAVVFLAVFYVIILPFGNSLNPLWIVSLFSDTMTQYNFVSHNAYNFWWATGNHWIPAYTMFGPLPFSSWGWIANGLTVLLCGAFFLLYKQNGRFHLTGALIYLSVFMFSHRMHERYLYPAVLLFLVAYIYDRKPFTLFLGLFFSAHNALNLTGALYWDGIFFGVRTFIAVMGVIGFAAAAGYAILMTLHEIGYGDTNGIVRKSIGRLFGMKKNISKFVWVLPAFFLSYFIWRRLFIFADDVFGMAQLRVRHLLLFPIASAAMTIIPAIKKFIDYSIVKPLKDKLSKNDTIVNAFPAIIALIVGPFIGLIGLGYEDSWLSGVFTAIGAIIFLFILLILIAVRAKLIGRYIRLLASAFADIRFVAAVILLNIYAVVFLLVARQTFFWDSAGYWQSAAYLSQMAFSSPVGLLRSVIGSIFTHDYNYLPAVIPAYVMAIFNTSRMAFVLAVVNFYVVPFWAMLYAVSKKTGGFTGFITSAFALVFVPFLAVVGFLDVGGIVFAFACVYLFFYSDEDGFVSGLILCATVMFRRWYVFFAIAFLICAIVYCLPVKERRRKLALMLFGFGGPMFVFFQGYVSGILLRDNFADIYYAYSFAIVTDIRFILRYFGWILLLGMLAYTVYSVRKKRNGFAAAFPLCCSILIFFLFVSIQSFGMQHLLLFAAPIAIACLNAAAERERWLRYTALIVAAMCFFSVFIPRAQPQTIHEIRGFSALPTISIYPQIREDAEELARLDDFVRGLDGGVAVLASSFVLNSDLLALVEPSLNSLLPLNANDRILHSPQVDRRDGLPFVLAYAEYIVAAYPVQTHLDPNEQRVVTVPAEALLSDTPFSAAFERLGVMFELRNGTTVYIFERTRPNTAYELEWLWESIQYADTDSNSVS